MSNNGVNLQEVDALLAEEEALPFGRMVYINDKIIYDCETAASGIHHPALLVSQIARQLANKYEAKAYIVNPPGYRDGTSQDLVRVGALKGFTGGEVTFTA